MIPCAVGMLLYWWRLKRWLDSLRGAFNAHKIMFFIGIISALALIQYTVTLGPAGEPYALARRTGVVLFFALCALAHLLLNKVLTNVIPNKSRHKLSTDTLFAMSALQQKLLALNALLIVIGLFSALLGFLWAGYQH